MRDIDENVKVILVSGFKQDTRIKEVLEMGVQRFLQKPYSLKKLAKALYEVINEIKLG